MSSTPKRTYLPLKEKLKVIEDRKKGNSVRRLAEMYGCGRSQIAEIVKNSEHLVKLSLHGVNLDSKLKCRRTGNEELDRLVLEWVTNCRLKNVPISGPMLRSSALQLAERLGATNFKASNGWLQKFRTRHRIYFHSSGETGDCQVKDAHSWRNNLADYRARDIYTCDKTGLFFRAIACSGSGLMSDACKDGAHADERLTLFLCCNAEGAFEKPLVIGNVVRPECFKNMELEKLPVSWLSNKKAWMTQSIMVEWLVALNEKMKDDERNILLLMDSESRLLENAYSNVKIVFIPLSDSKACQLLNQGIIQALKLQYRILQIRSLVSATVDHLTNPLSVLDAINWIGIAVRQISGATVRKRFATLGIRVSATVYPTFS